jgi:non-ribosomal peptide synthetase component E (peptide arylation enzyme)
VSGAYARTYDDALPRYSAELVERYRTHGYWGNDTLTERLRAVAGAAPEQTAVVDGATRLTYRELIDRIDATRRGLAGLGLGHGDYVTAQLPNWWELVVAMFAIVETGAVFVPTNVRMRGDLEYVLRYTGSRALLLPETFHGFPYRELVAGFEERLPELEHVIVVRPEATPARLSFDALMEAGGDGPERVRPGGIDPWQIVFTSGTTSAPKGVLRTHDNTLWTIRNLVHHYGLMRGDGTDVALAILPISFIFAQYLNQLGALLTGGTLVLQDRFEAAAALDLIEQEGVTFTGVVPSMVPTFLDVPGLASRSFPSMRMVSPAGEAVTRERKEQLEQLFGCDTCESYGLAEMTWPLAQKPGSAFEKRMSTTGATSPAAELRIVDDEGKDVGADEVGELLLRGPTLFPGYFRNPAATAAAIDDDGWFKSGDLVRLDADGFYSICGRKKDMIKRSGIQVLPQEIEDALEEHPAVHAVGVIGLPDERRGEIACACVVLRPGNGTGPEELLEFLRGRLATYKLPERIELMESLPLSPNGKVLKTELRALVLEAPPV